VDFDGKDPLVDASALGPRASDSERNRTTERRRVRRRARVESRTRSKIRLRVWLACTGALLVMALGLWMVLGRDGAGSGLGAPTTVGSPVMASLATGPGR